MPPETIILDEFQLLAQQKLGQFAQNIGKTGFFWQKRTGQALYLYGGTGRGKTMLMDAFYEKLPQKNKLRTHFFEFMGQFHKQFGIYTAQRHPDPFLATIETCIKPYFIICFDEFHIVNIADAMILARLIERAIDMGVNFVFTSNFAPDELYENGLQRENFLPFIQFIKKNSIVFHLDSPTDYRYKTIAKTETILTPNNPQNNQRMDELFHYLRGNNPVIPAKIKADGREVEYITTAGRVLLSNFDELCERQVWVADYTALALRFDIIMIKNIPIFTNNNLNGAKRFITLIDILYNHKIKCLFVCATPIDQLHQTQTHAPEMARTISRLREMSSY